MRNIRESLLKCGFQKTEIPSSDSIGFSISHIKSDFEIFMVTDMELTENTKFEIIINNNINKIYNSTTMLEKDLTVEMLNKLFKICKLDIMLVEPVDVAEMCDESDIEPDNILTKEKLINNGFTWFEYMDNSTNNHYGECSLVTEEYSVCVHFLFEPYYEIFGPETSHRSQCKKTHNIKTFNRMLKQCGIDLVIQ